MTGYKRSYTVHGVTTELDEVYVTTVYSAAQGKAAHADMKTQGKFDYIRLRDCLGGLRFEYNLKTGRKTA